MSSKNKIEVFFLINLNKLCLYVFEGKEKTIFKKEVLIAEIKKEENFDDLLDNFFGENILKIEKEIKKFINEINLIIFDQNFLLIQSSIKKKGEGDKIKKRDLNHMLFDLKQQIKENNLDKTITYMRINNFLIDNNKYLNIENNFECDELCLQIDFICLPKKIIEDFSNKIKKYQIRVDKIFSAKYLNEYCSHHNENECEVAARLKYENDQNEVHFIKKRIEKKGFFERFFRFFG